jgi:RHS repeat-associated protein
VAPALPGLSLGGFVIPAEDGSEIYFFDPTGHHFKTVDALTGALLYNFTYNSAGQLASVQDVYGNTTTIERNAIGDPTAIVSPFGQRTALSLDAVGFLATITNPANEMHSFTYKSAGLLATMTDPRNNTWRFEYDDLGRLIRDEDPAGGFQTLARAQVPYGYEVTRTTALGTTTTYRVEHLPTGETRLVNTLPCCGVKTEVLIGTDGTRIITLADGTVVTQAEGPDPRFGMLSPLVTSASITTPAGLEANMMVSRTTGLDDPTDPTSLQKLTDSTSINGRIYTAVFETSLRQLAQTGPEGLQSTITFDHQGRPLEVRPDSRLDPLRFDYDTRGNLTKALWGGDSLTLDYDPQGRLASETDAALSQTEYTYDDANRVTQLKLPGGRLYQFTYDTAGNLTAVIAPSGAVHGFGYTAANLEESYTAPGGMSYLTTYDKERRVSAYALPSRRTTSTTYDAGGRVQQISYPEATVSFTYQDATARPTAITRIPSGAGSSQTVALAYDAFLQTEKTWRGIANGTYRYRYDNNFFPVGMTFDNDLEIPLTRDDDGLVVQYGPFTISRGGPIGAPVRIEDGNLNISYEYDSWGRLARRTHTVNGQVIYDIQLTYGNTRRIIQKVESVRGTTHTYSYGYDQDGQLVEVTRDGVIVEEYSYDPHGNRATRRLGSAPEEALTYDPRDRLTKRGNTSYRFDDDGFLVSRGTDAFEYSAVGELLSAVLGGAQSVAYTYDAFNCPVGRTDAGGIYQYFYGDVDRFYLLTASRDPVGALSIYYYDDTEHLFAMERGGTRYYVGSDQVGTPLIVTDPTGQTAKLLQYDSFGNLITDTNPGFDLPIGFAGGISDRKTELTRFGARNYEPEAGRWTALDPLLLEGDELNFYVYVGNDPINWRDPTGLQRWAPPPKPRPKAPRPLKEYEKTVKNAEETTPEVEKTGNKVKKAWQQSCGALAGEE